MRTRRLVINSIIGAVLFMAGYEYGLWSAERYDVNMMMVVAPVTEKGIRFEDNYAGRKRKHDIPGITFRAGKDVLPFEICSTFSLEDSPKPMRASCEVTAAGNNLEVSAARWRKNRGL